MAKINSEEELNLAVTEIETKIEAVQAEAIKKDDFELVQKDNKELRTLLEATQKSLEDLKEVVKNNYTSKSAEEKLYIFGKFLMAARRNDLAEVHRLGGKINTVPQSDDWKGGDWDINAAPDLGTPLRGDATTGSYLVPEEFAREVLRLPESPSALMPLVRTVPMTVRKISYPAKLAGVTFSWPTNEVTAKTEKNPTFANVELEAKTAAGWIPFTEELTEDSLVPLAEYFASLFREAWQKEFDFQLLDANAAPFTGVLRASGVKTYTMNTGKTSFADATLDDISALIAKITSQAQRTGGMLIMHVTVQDIFRKLKDDQGNYIYAAPAGNQPGTIWGYSVINSDAMPDAASSAAGTAFVAFGNPKGLLHGDRIGMEIKIFDQTADALVYDRLFLRCRLRQGFKVALPAGFSILKTAAS